MKKILFSAALLQCIAGFAQTAIDNFYSNANAGDSFEMYSLVTSESEPNQANAGANVAWDFNDLVEVGENGTIVSFVNTADAITYPGTTHKAKTFTSVTDGDISYYLAVDATGETSITGAETSAISLNYSTNNGFIGNFPLAYGFTNADAVAGSFWANGTEGTFTGTITSTVDAYGTLTTNIGSFGNNTPVTRLKITQDLILLYNSIPVGTLTQTIYNYYNSTMESGPLFRSTSITISVPALSINETQSTLESYRVTMGTHEVKNSLNLSFAPNPVKDVLHFAGDAEIRAVTIIDAAGRTVLQSATANDISVSHLSAGIYYATVTAGSGVTTLKMVKE